MIINIVTYRKRIGDNDDLIKKCDKYKNIKFHLSKEKITELVDSDNINNELAWFKPRGLYFGFGCPWIDFVIDGLGKDPCCYIYQIIINDDKIKYINTIDQLTDFGNEIINDQPIRLFFDDMKKSWINWILVSQKYNGIGINITQKTWFDNYRMQNDWFYAWDIPSGAIWKLHNVTIKLIFHKYENVWYQVNDIIRNAKYKFKVTNRGS
jgi:hypothetical protein